ncbi:hypothetical protein DYB26_014588 [Aphanomyces astaci]|uniref:START domain-containing protein n=1 Tax=Aphanomyces astaci TaxID=112090 RepID=A0A397ELG8_APHAT|nr:hypothetical protein DYB31_015197 [Aphanomyces astaci]RHZ33250.1 hypothetical protein DYB26_014588 [Aphanomyces astaci]
MSSLEIDGAADSIRLLLAMESSPTSSLASKDKAAGGLWTEVKVVDDITVFRGVVPGCEWNAVKATGIIPSCSAPFLASKLLDDAEMPRFDKMVAYVSVLSGATSRATCPATTGRHMQLKPVLVTKARDFVVTTTTTNMQQSSAVDGRKDDVTTIVIASRSTSTWPAAPSHSFVRGVNHLSGYILRPVVVVVGTQASCVGCHVTLIAHVDPGGLLPPRVLCSESFGGGPALEVAAAFSKVVQQRRSYQQRQHPWTRPSSRVWTWTTRMIECLLVNHSKPHRSSTISIIFRFIR